MGVGGNVLFIALQLTGRGYGYGDGGMMGTVEMEKMMIGQIVLFASLHFSFCECELGVGVGVGVGGW